MEKMRNTVLGAASSFQRFSGYRPRLPFAFGETKLAVCGSSDEQIAAFSMLWDGN
jgi:hypothetical protein